MDYAAFPIKYWKLWSKRERQICGQVTDRCDKFIAAEDFNFHNITRDCLCVKDLEEVEYIKCF